MKARRTHHLTLRNGSDYRSQEVKEIIGRVPPWIIRWGTAVFFFFFIALFAAAWLIPYPTIVSASFRLTSLNAPKSVHARTDGKLVGLFVAENSRVHKHQVLAYIESTADHAQVLALSTYLDSLSGVVSKGNIALAATLVQPSFSHLGELQPAYQKFNQDYVDLLSVLAGGFYLNKRRILKQEHEQLVRMGKNLQEQLEVSSRDLELARQEYAAQQKLADEKVIAALEYKREESKYLAKQMHLKKVESALIENQTAQSVKLKEFLELDNVIARQQNTFLQSLNTLRSETESWKQKYLLRAPLDGQVYFPSIIEENQHVVSGGEVFYVAPLCKDFLGELHIRQYNLGKVKKGQRVLIKFASYPFEEFGLVEGRIASISEIPTPEGSFLAKVRLLNGLTTTTGKQIVYKTGMLATGEVVTEDTNLIERVFYQLRKAFR